jgi:hypothetical protein
MIESLKPVSPQDRLYKEGEERLPVAKGMGFMAKGRRLTERWRLGEKPYYKGKSLFLDPGKGVFKGDVFHDHYRG